MRPLILALCLSAAGCSSFTPEQHQARVGLYRAALPRAVRMGNTHSMSTVIPAGSMQVISPLPYARLQSGMVVVFWPIGYSGPVCHFIGRRIGTDSWETHGMNSSAQGGPVRGDLAGLGFMLTRENYIGVVFPFSPFKG